MNRHVGDRFPEQALVAQNTGSGAPAGVAALDDAVLDALAERVADVVVERLQASRLVRAVAPVDAATVARAIGMSVEFVRDHADELGGRRLGDGPRPRLRFDLDMALDAWGARSASERSDEPGMPMGTGGPGRRRGRGLGTRADLLPIREPRGVRRAA